jgi:type IV pilus assembly protein PilM
MSLSSLFKRKEALTAIDIGSTSIKVAEFTFGDGEPTLVNLGVRELGEEIFEGGIIAKPELVAESIGALVEQAGLGLRRVVTAASAPNVFTKRIVMPKGTPKTFSSSVRFEAANFIPHKLDAVSIDYSILGELPRNQVEVLVVAAKNDFVQSYLNCVGLAGLDTAIIDVDFFALGNTFERAYPEDMNKNVAIVNVGARYSAVTLYSAGKCVYTGDVAVGGNTFTEAIMKEKQINRKAAEVMKRGLQDTELYTEIAHVLESKLEYVVGELNRQLGLFWNAAGAGQGIEKVYITGGGSMIPGFTEELESRTQVSCSQLHPLQGISIGSTIDMNICDEHSASLGVVLGLAGRVPGDRGVH